MSPWVRIAALMVALGLFAFACSKKPASTPSEAAPASGEKAAAAEEKVPADEPEPAAAPAKAAEDSDLETEETPPPAPPPAPDDGVRLWSDIGLKTPESVLYDPVDDVYLVSNIDGSPLGTDGNGFITRIKPDGEVVHEKWIGQGSEAGGTLDAPKGMAISGDVLFVADISVVRTFDRRSGKPDGTIEIAGATFLNDMATAPDGAVFVSDSGMLKGEKGFEPSGTDAVYRIDEDGDVDKVASGTDLGRPNGLVVVGKDVWVVTFGSGEIYKLSGGELTGRMKLPEGSLDGVVRLGDGSLLISSWDAGAVYRGQPGGPFEVAVKELRAPADIGWDGKRKRLLVPLFQSDAVKVVPVQ